MTKFRFKCVAEFEVIVKGNYRNSGSSQDNVIYVKALLMVCRQYNLNPKDVEVIGYRNVLGFC